MNQPLYVITAVNKLTGEREVISRPHSQYKTEQLLTKAKRDTARHRAKPCYALHRMELWPNEEERIKFSGE